MYKIILSAIAASVLLPASALAACGPGQPCLSWVEAPRATATTYQAAPQTHYRPSVIQSPQLAGLAPDETLCATPCPVSVDAPAGSKVLDCYGICKKVTRQVFAAPRQQYRIVRVVRPLVYIQQPAPPNCRMDCKAARYGY